MKTSDPFTSSLLYLGVSSVSVDSLKNGNSIVKTHLSSALLIVNLPKLDMSLKTLATCAVLALRVFSVFASPIDNRSIDGEDLVMTPGGLVPRSNVVAVPEGARVHHTSNQVQLVGADGTIIHSAQITKEVSGKSSLSVVPPTVAPRALSSGYVAYAYAKNSGTSPITSFSTSWAVPANPASSNGQLLYYFNALVPDSLDAILQPVLQFGVSPAGGGSYWAVASWFIVGSITYYSPLTQVQPGQMLHGVMTRNTTTSPYKWNSVFTGVTHSSLTISTTEVLDYAYEALEIYTASSASSLPVGQTAMTAINVVTQNGQSPALTWTAVGDPTDGISMSIVSPSTTSGSMQIKYPTA
ncbi:hypothetical protein GALMADRAFT_159667 [Galerina marginata CBS 339.88]|uniref:Uncharacterized protein n=1 Tax=Galerina marginata (strain CBS 339.88) TaxID=685588 RepID=A0A067SSW7_GALM3|nr:hypothetical protein GALMADRAFT_159667 [Galerina marginata CBS 339.88]